MHVQHAVHVAAGRVSHHRNVRLGGYLHLCAELPEWPDLPERELRVHLRYDMRESLLLREHAELLVELDVRCVHSDRGLWRGSTCTNGICGCATGTICGSTCCTGAAPVCSGSTCVQCVKDGDCGAGQTCVSGTCTSCGGCIDGSGACQAGTSDSACGTSGASCASCGSGKTCVTGTCTSCGGCIDGSGACQAGTSDPACGTSGASCASCGSGRRAFLARCTGPARLHRTPSRRLSGRAPATCLRYPLGLRVPAAAAVSVRFWHRVPVVPAASTALVSVRVVRATVPVAPPGLRVPAAEAVRRVFLHAVPVWWLHRWVRRLSVGYEQRCLWRLLGRCCPVAGTVRLASLAHVPVVAVIDGSVPVSRHRATVPADPGSVTACGDGRRVLAHAAVVPAASMVPVPVEAGTSHSAGTSGGSCTSCGNGKTCVTGTCTVVPAASMGPGAC